MAVRAAAKFVDASIELGVPPSLMYGVSFYVTIGDDQFGTFTNIGLLQVQVPALLSQKKADQLVRQGLVDQISAITNGIIIDPDDIYIPFSA